MRKIVNLSISFFVAFMLTVGSYSNVRAASIYYVSLTGSDANSGASSAPFKTFAKAVSVLVPGDTLRIYAGTYTEQLKVSKSGAAGMLIAIKPVAGQAVILDGGTTRPTPLWASGSYLLLEGLEVKRSSTACVQVDGNNITLRSLVVHDCLQFGVRIKSRNVVLANSLIYATVTENLNGIQLTIGGGWNSAVRVGLGGQNVTIRNNSVYNNWGEGIAVTRGSVVNIYDNLVHDNFSQNIYIDNSYDVNVERNFVHSLDPAYYRAGTPANCIAMADELYTGWGAQLARIRIVNNIAAFCKTGIGYTYTELTDGGMDTAVIAHNTIWGNKVNAIRVIAGPKTGNSVIANNIIQQSSGNMTSIATTSGITFKNNFWVGPARGIKSGPGDRTGDVKLASTPGTLPQSYRLSGGSPAITGGVSLGVTNDFESKPRGPLYDMGAIQYGGVAAATSTATGAPPSSTPTSAAAPTATLSLASPTASKTSVPVTATKTVTAPAASPTATSLVGNPSATPTQIPATPTIVPTGSTSLSIRVASGADDVEESATGSMYLDSTDLELVYDVDNQAVGLRFNGVNIPNNAIIVNAYIQFKVDETPSAATILTIGGEASPNAAAFTAATQNVSSRTLTAASVNWTPLAWPIVNAADLDQRTPNLALIIQQIISLPGWASGNSIVLVITGNGKRVAEAFEGDAAGAPLLVVEYIVP
ncbi:MAG: right-handed parallel beta-helix repeat-containing protein [Chloroflexi bacterium]|nr:right-handed parallel beta-helix repeat-containing protein [Chloroflexota bacterium]